MKSISTLFRENIKKSALLLNYLIWLLFDFSKFKRFNKEKIKKIVIIHQGAIGEIIFASSILRPLKNEFNAEIDFVVGKGKEDILKENLFISNIYSLTGIFKKDVEILKNKKYDLAVILFPGSTKMAYLCKKAGINYRIGCFPKAIDPCFFFNKRTFPLMKEHALINNLRMLNTIGIKTTNPKLEFYVSGKDMKNVKKFLKNNRFFKYAIIHPGFGGKKTRYPSRHWPEERYAEIARHLVENYSFNVLITGDKNERGLAQKIKNLSKSNRVINVAGKFSFGELACLVKKSKIVIEPSTSIGHVASAFNIPHIALMGRGDPTEWKPLGKNSRYIFHNEVCTSCNLDYCRKKTIECMKSITVKDVKEKINELVK